MRMAGAANRASLMGSSCCLGGQSGAGAIGTRLGTAPTLPRLGVERQTRSCGTAVPLNAPDTRVDTASTPPYESEGRTLGNLTSYRYLINRRVRPDETAADRRLPRPRGARQALATGRFRGAQTHGSGRAGMSPLGKGKPGAALSARGSQPLTQRERREERERVRKWGPFRAIAEVLKADQTRECSRVLFACGHEATVMKTLTTRARCFLCRPGRPEAEACGTSWTSCQSRPDHRVDRRRARRYSGSTA